MPNGNANHIIVTITRRRPEEETEEEARGRRNNNQNARSVYRHCRCRHGGDSGFLVVVVLQFRTTGDNEDPLSVETNSPAAPNMDANKTILQGRRATRAVVDKLSLLF
jgi:hypothetical protein